ncbi:MAG: bifunctional riboflavin kinase/FAD synthetase [Candidatus Izemoplasmatales bacterium]|nr:bifunctional riboflavin kinase/FAD synthetase [Candidatus Izemoplasmatales bacterium]
MKTIYLNATDPMNESNLALCLGFFDGVHLAHQTLLRETILQAKKRQLEPAMMTFSTHILSHIRKEPFFHLTSLNDKIEIARDMGFSYFYVLVVTDEMIGVSPQDFIDRFLSMQRLILVGFDFTFGFRGKGNAAWLQEQTSFETIVLPEMDYANEKIGSTRIRALIQEGQMEEAEMLLGMPYTIHGEVIHGKNRGKALGFPTANLRHEGYMRPKSGVYVAKVEIDGNRFDGLANIGDNPTFDDDDISIEVHILDFQGQIYGKRIALSFLHFLREEIKYHSVNDLIEQMMQDVLDARVILKERS